MNSDERTRRIHDALNEHVDVREGEVLAGWVVVYETATMDDRLPVVGRHVGPEGMTDWRALGLLEWAAQMLGPPEIDDDDELDDELDEPD